MGKTTTEAYIRTGSLTNYSDLARGLGLDPVQMLARVGLPASCLGNADLRVRAEPVMRLLELSAELGHEPAFGLRLAETRRMSTLGLLGLLVRDEPTLRQALSTLRRFGRLHNEAVSLTVEDPGPRAGGATLLRFDFVPVPGAGRQAVELAVGAIHRILRIMLGAEWQARSVNFTHAAPASLAVHRRTFGPNVRFGQEVTGIVVASDDLDAPSALADPVMRAYARQLLDKETTQTRAQTRHEVQQLILALLPAGRCSADQVALHLGVDRRTVHRRLAQEGRSFSELVQQTRVDLFERHRADGQRTLTELAQLLGFGSLSALSRWKRGL